MSLQTLSYMGLPNCLKLSNGTVDVIATTDVGPRILFYGPRGGANVLGQFPNSSKETALGTWKPYGGHRLWVAPELFPGTYAPDNDPIEHTAEGDLGVVLRQPVDKSGFQKQIRITLSETGTKVTVEHTVTSHNLWPVEIAVWAVSIVACGTAIVPRVPFQTHDEHVAVTQPLALCAFTDLGDPRFTLGNRYLMLRADPAMAHSQKFGLRNKQDWCAHLVDDTLFVKRFTHHEGERYPDYDVNTEVYVEGSFMEVELLGPRRLLVPGESTTLSESWHLFEKVGVTDVERDPEVIHKAIAPSIETLF